MIKFRLYYDKDKMTEYLNEMSRKGYALRGFFAGFLRFDRCRPGEYAYQVDITEGLFRLKDDYREFMQDMDVEIVCLWGFWAVLQKKAKDGPFVLYTDVESGIEHYSRIQRVFKKAVIVETLGLVLEVAAGLRGYALGWAGVFLLAAILAGMLRELARVSDIIARLKERRGEAVCRKRRGEISALIPLGLLLNGIGFLLPEDLMRLPEGISGIMGAPQNLSDCFQLLGLVVFAAGFLHTLLRHRE